MKVFNIRDYGAKFTDQLQTKHIQAAIDDCFLAGGGRVLVPCGVYYTGSFRLRSNVELYLEAGAIIRGSRKPEDYFGWMEDKLEPVTMEEVVDGDPKRGRSSLSTSRWSNGLIRAIDAENIAIIGEKGSYFDGCYCMDPEGENNYRGPHGFSFWRCKNIRLEGYTFINSSNWCHAIFQSQNITIKNIAISGGFDGIDIRTCDNVHIEKAIINSGDDAIAGFDNNDVIVRDCTLNTACMPLRLGGNNILVENCVSDERRFGSRLRLTDEEKILGELTNERVRHESHAPFSYYCDGRADPRRQPGNIVIRNCHFMQEHELMRLEFTGLHRWCSNRSLRSFTFEDCSICDLIDPGMIWGDENEKVIAHFKNVKIACRPGAENQIIAIAGNFEKLVFENCTFEGYTDPTIWVGTDDEVEFIGTAPVKVEKKTQDECFARRGNLGLASQDYGKGLKFDINTKK